MEAVRSPVAPPGGGRGIFFSSSGAPRPPKSLSFSSPTGCSRFSPQNSTQPPPSYAAHSLTGGSCYRRASSVSRPSNAAATGGGGYRTAGSYRCRSGSVPPPAENGKGDVSPSTSGGPTGLRRPGVGRALVDGTLLDGTVANDKVGPLGGRSAAHRGLVWAQLDLLHMDCANNGGGGSQSQTCSENTSPTEAFCISIEERLIKTNPIWFLADLQRVGAVHLLQGKEDGTFLVRQSSQSETLAISVRLPPDKGPHVQHYLVEIQPHGQYSLEASDNRFASLPELLAYYTECCDELPVKLKLPKCVQDAKTRHELASIALLGQEFWGTTMASPSSTPVDGEEKFLPVRSPTIRPSDLSFSSFGKGSLSRSNLSNSNSPLTPMGSHLGDSTLSLTPTRPAPPVPPLALDRSTLNLNLASQEESFIESNVTSPPFSSFKNQSNTPQTPQSAFRPTPPPRNSPPNTHIKAPKPTPPVRSSPPTEPAQSPSNITVTTTLTFNVNQIKNLPLSGSSPSTPSSTEDFSREGIQLHVSSLEISPCSSGTPNSNCRESLKLHFRPPYSSPPSQPQTPLTPLSENGSEDKVRLRKGKSKRKDSSKSNRSSTQYHDSSILIEPPFHRSSLADKISDYEDLWTTPPCDVIVSGSGGGGFFSPTVESSRTPLLQSFKPSPAISKSMGDLSDVMRRERDGIIHNGVDTSEESLEGRQASSPFYVEPLDALKKYHAQNSVDDKSQNRPRIRRSSRKLPANRHSDSNIEMRSRRARNILARIEDNALEDNLSSSQEEMENIDFEGANNALNSSNTNINGGRKSKIVTPPKLFGSKPFSEHSQNSNAIDKPTHNWIDASWEFLSYIGNSTSNDGDSALIPGELTVQSLIKKRLPHLILNNNLLNNPYQNLAVNSGQNLSSNLTKNYSRYSEYDNVGFGSKNDCRPDSHIPRNDSNLSHYIASSVSDSGTEFSEPWDSRKWDSILQDPHNESLNEPHPMNLNSFRNSQKVDTDSDTDSLVQVTGDSACDSNEESQSVAPTLSLSQKSNMDTNLRSKILSPQMLALRHRKDAESGAAVRRYALSLGYDSSTTFSQAIRHFLTCTLESTEREAAIVVRNVRQFMSGMKNYLVTSGEGEFEPIVTRERSNLKPNEFLNLDAILEDVLVRLVLRPLWTHINQLYVESLTSDGSIQKLADNIASAKALPYSKLGIRSELIPPKGTALEAIQILLLKMQHVYAPREKLAHLLGMISHLYHAMYENGAGVTGTGDADDLVPMIMYVLIQCEVVSAEVEADYIQGLLLPSTASGEASYYLSAFQSAIHSLKNFDGKDSPNHSPGESLNSLTQDSSCVSDHGVLRVIVPDEKNGSIVTRTLPIRPNITARELCRMMAHKLRVTNPQDFALYKLIDGHEWLLGDNECPQKIRNEISANGSHCLIAFKRIDAKIAWPLNK